MKQLFLILALFAMVAVQAQDIYVYKLKFEKQSQIEILDSTMTFAKVQPSIIEWKQNLFNSDSTAVYEKGFFYDVISNKELPQLNAYIVDPYPTKFNHCFAGIDETNAIFIKP